MFYVGDLDPFSQIESIESKWFCTAVSWDLLALSYINRVDSNGTTTSPVHAYLLLSKIDADRRSNFPSLPCFVSFVATVTSSPLEGRNSFRKQCLLFLGKRETRRSFREIKFWKISYKFHVKEISVDLLIICLLTP